MFVRIIKIFWGPQRVKERIENIKNTRFCSCQSLFTTSNPSPTRSLCRWCFFRSFQEHQADHAWDQNSTCLQILMLCCRSSAESVQNTLYNHFRMRSEKTASFWMILVRFACGIVASRALETDAHRCLDSISCHCHLLFSWWHTANFMAQNTRKARARWDYTSSFAHKACKAGRSSSGCTKGARFMLPQRLSWDLPFCIVVGPRPAKTFCPFLNEDLAVVDGSLFQTYGKCIINIQEFLKGTSIQNARCSGPSRCAMATSWKVMQRPWSSFPNSSHWFALKSDRTCWVDQRFCQVQELQEPQFLAQQISQAESALIF